MADRQIVAAGGDARPIFDYALELLRPAPRVL
jgi:hypothetical protein